jgi:hypothetical protein
VFDISLKILENKVESIFRGSHRIENYTISNSKGTIESRNEGRYIVAEGHFNREGEKFGKRMEVDRDGTLCLQ